MKEEIFKNLFCRNITIKFIKCAFIPFFHFLNRSAALIRVDCWSPVCDIDVCLCVFLKIWGVLHVLCGYFVFYICHFNPCLK